MSYMKKPAIIIPVAASAFLLMGSYPLPAYAEIDPPTYDCYVTSTRRSNAK